MIAIISFLSDKHEVRFHELLLRDGDGKGDVEREALFFVLAGSYDIYKKAATIYDFEDRSIIPECLDGGVDLSSGDRALVMLALNLFNSFPASRRRGLGVGLEALIPSKSLPTAVMDIFSSLDADGRKLAIEAIKVRFRMS